MNTPETPTHTGERQFTPAQWEIVKSYQAAHGIEPEQISFDGDSLTPVFDHNAISVLSLKLTDIVDISPTRIDQSADVVTVFGTTTLPNGRSRGWIGSCSFGEKLPNGTEVKDRQVAIGVATSRGFRQGIRNVGIDLVRAHQRFLQTGEVDQGNAKHDPRKANYAELKILAGEVDLIVDGDETLYRQFMAGICDGITSAKDLNDLQLHQLLVHLRIMAEVKRQRAAPKVAA